MREGHKGMISCSLGMSWAAVLLSITPSPASHRSNDGAQTLRLSPKQPQMRPFLLWAMGWTTAVQILCWAHWRWHWGEPVLAYRGWEKKESGGRRDGH